MIALAGDLDLLAALRAARTFAAPRHALLYGVGRLDAVGSLADGSFDPQRIRHVQPPAGFVGRIIGPVVVDLRYRHDAGHLIIEHQGVATDRDDGNRMLKTANRIVEYHQPEILVWNPESPQHHELGDRIVLALAILVEEFERRLPMADLAPVLEG